MKYENLEKSLEKEIAPVYMINGGESYLTTNALKMIEKALNITLKEFNKTVYLDTFSKNAEVIVDNLQVLPIVDEKRLVIVHDYINKPNANEKAIFEKYIKNPSKTSCLVFFSTNKSPFFSTFENIVTKIECDSVETPFLINFISNIVEENGFKIDRDATYKLIDYCNGSITKIDVELNKLMDLRRDEKTIKVSDIEIYTTKDLEYMIFDLSNALSEKNYDKSYALIYAMLRNNEKPTSILATLTNHFKRLFFVSRSSLTSEELSQILGVKESAIYRYRGIVKSFSQKTLKNIYDNCVNIEYQIKSGVVDSKNALFILISNILNK